MNPPRRAQPNRGRRYLPVLAILAPWLCTAGCRKEPPPKPAAPGPNVVLITFDTTRADRFSCYGYTAIRTPTVDSLAARGIRYAQCDSPVPITLPSHASILTGLYPFQHGLRDNGASPLDHRFITLAELLADRGYRTGAFVGAYVLNSRFGLDQGFQTYDDDFTSRALPSKLMIPERNAQAVTDAALAWLAEAPDAPYFLWAHYFDPHMPYSPPGLPPGTLNQPAYDQEIVYADAQLGRLLTRVEQRDRQTGRSTWIVFTADHAESLLEHGEPTHAYFVYESTLRVPLVVVPPTSASKPSPGVIDDPVNLVDLFPSILDWLSIAAPYPTPGRPLPVPGANVRSGSSPDETPASAPRAFYFETFMPFHTYGWSPLEGIRVGTKKYIAAPKPELYDLARDPSESKNLYSPDAPDASSLRQALLTLKSARLSIPAPSSGAASTDEASRKALRALGYAGGQETPPEDISALRDPKDMLEWHVRGAADAELKIDSAHAVESVPVLAAALRADPDNRWVLALLSELLDRQETFAAIVPLALERLTSPLPPPHDHRLPAALALALARNDRAEEAVSLLTPLVERSSDSAEFRFALAAALLAARKPEDGIAHLRRAIELDPRNRPARVLLGDTLFSEAMLRSDAARAQDLFAVAAEQYRAAVDASVDLPPPPHVEGAAEVDVPGVPSVAPGVTLAQLHVKLAAALRRLSQTENALHELRRAVDLDPDCFEARCELGELLLESKQTDEAETQYREAVRLRPDDPDARYNLGGLFLQSNRPEPAVEHLSQVVRIKPDHGSALINLGIALFRMGKKEEAKEAFRKAIEIPDSAAEACHSLGIALAREGNTDESLAYFERAFVLDPTKSGAIEELLSTYIRGHRIADAVRILRAAVAATPGNVRYLNVLAQILATSPDDSIRSGTEALDLARRANGLSGDQHPAVLGTLAAALAETGDFDQATATTERALSILARTPPQPSTTPAPPSVAEHLRVQLSSFRERKPFRDGRY